MNLMLSDEQVMLQDSVAKLFGDHSTGQRIRAAEATGFDPDLWARVCEVGIPLLRVPEPQGGSDAGLLESVLVAEQAGRHLASAPVIEAMVAARLLSACGDAGTALLQQVVRGSAAGTPVVTLALEDVGRRRRQLVPQGEIAEWVICLEGSRLLAIHTAKADDAAARAQNLAAMPLADMDLSEGVRTVLSEGAATEALYRTTLEEWKLLTAAWIASGAHRAVEIASEYARGREAFGKPIGTYQGLVHPLVDSAVEVEGARLLVWRVVDELARGTARAGALGAMAWYWSAHVCGRATTKAMRVFGGYGMSLEYDAQLYFRRVTAASLLIGDPEAQLDEAAQRLWCGRPVSMPEAGPTGITFEWDASCDETMRRARAFCEPRDTAEMKHFRHTSDDWNQPELYREMAQAGLLYPDWPKEYGGGGLRPMDALAVDQVIADFGWYLLPRITTNMVGKMILHFGTEEAKRDILPRLASGGSSASLGYSEPSGGSDVFAARTKAVRDGDDWVINGQKMFTSQGHIADYCLMIARTAPDKHRGVTLFVVPLRQPGYSFTEIKTVGDERTNVTFYEDVRVPDLYRLGEVNGGVKVLVAALKLEQGGDLYTSFLQSLLDAALEWAGTERAGERPMDRVEVRRVLADVATRVAVQDVLTRRTIWAASSGRADKAHGPMAKLFGTETLVSASARLLQLAAPWSLMKGTDALGTLEREFRRAIPSTIYAGTSEIQRSLIAESALGMPRSR